MTDHETHLFPGFSTERVLEMLRSHLNTECQILAATAETLDRICQLLIQNRGDDLEQLAGERAGLLAESSRLAGRRAEFLQELARRFDLVQEGVTLGAVAEAAGSSATWLAERRTRLRVLIEQNSRLSRLVTAIVVNSADRAREIVRRLTNSEAGDSYDADGIRQDASGGFMFDLDG